MRPLHLSTFVSCKSQKLLDHLSILAGRYGGQGHTILFALSANFKPVTELGDAVNRLVNFNHLPRLPGGEKGTGRVVGCLSDSLASVRPLKGLGGTPDVLSCSVAVLDTRYCLPFYSSLPGRSKPQVGRWHAFRKGDPDEDTTSLDRMDAASTPGGEVDWDQVWNAPKSRSLELMPEALRSVNSDDVLSVLHMSVHHPDHFLEGLSTALPSALSLGLYASPTHFVTGRPVTLFLDDRIYSEGSVGVALLRAPEGKEPVVPPSLRTDFLGASRMSKPMIVSSVEGNMVNSLDDSNPTQLLLQAIQSSGLSTSEHGALASRIFKEDEEFALGILDTSGQITQAYRITAGDPAHRGGSISLDATRSPPVGSTVQFLSCSTSSSTDLSSSFLPAERLSLDRLQRQRIAFITTPEVDHAAALDDVSTGKADSLLLEDIFLASSHLGFVSSAARNTSQTVSEHIGSAWSSSIKGSMGMLEWERSE